MASEVKRNLARIIANYVRLALTLCLGIVMVRLLFRAVGQDGFGLIGLLGSAAGISSMFQMIVQRSMIRELGRAYHDKDPDAFVGTFNSAVLLTWGAAVLSCVLFGVMYLLLPFFDINDELRPAAGWFLLAVAIQTAGIVALSAPMNMYVVKERMAIYNTWLVLERSAFTLAAAAILYVIPSEDAGRGVVTYGFIAAGFIILTHLTGATLMILSDPRLRPRPGRINKKDLREVLHVGGWNTGVVASLNLHHQADNLIMNFWFALFGNAVFSLAMRLTGYVRMLATGMTVGLDAVSARISSDERGESRMARLMYHTTRMHALATFPAILTMCLLAEPVLRLWIAKTLENPELIIPKTVYVTWAMGLGITCHAIGDGWITVLYGAGHIRRYAPLVIAGGVANPFLAVLLLVILPDPLKLIGPALGYSLIMLVAHFVMLPMIAARVIGVRVTEIYTPLVRPLVAAVAAMPVPIAALMWIDTWNLPWLAVVAVGYAGAYAVLSYFIVLTADERTRARAAGLRILNRRKTPANGAAPTHGLDETQTRRGA